MADSPAKADPASKAGMPRTQVFGEGRPVVCLHGWSATGDFFTCQKPLTAHGVQLILPDLPGHGPGATADDTLSIGDLADALASFLVRKKLQAPVLVGWSMGAAVALEYLRRPDARPVSGLVIVEMTAKVANDGGWCHGLAGGQGENDMLRAADAMATDWSAFAPRIAKALFARGIPPDPVWSERATAAFAANNPATMASLWRSLAKVDSRATLAQLATPTLCIPILALFGQQSRIYGPDLADWYAKQGNITVERIANAGHAPQIEQPEAFNRALLAFLESLPAG